MIKNDECLDDLQNGLFIIQKKNGFKFGIDAVLLSDFAKETRSKKTLDLLSLLKLCHGEKSAMKWNSFAGTHG